VSNEKRYTITVTEHAVETVIAGKSWEKDAGEGGRYGYTPEIEKRTVVVRKVFEQNTDELDLVNVIKAVNGLER